MAVQIDLVPLLVAIIGSGGIGAAATKLIDALLKVRGGMAARESKRRVDIVQQRDEAIDYGERQAVERRAAQEYASRLRRKLIEAGVEPGAEPEFEQTITKAQLKQLRETE